MSSLTPSPTFANGFDSYSCVGDTIDAERDGFTLIAQIVFDEDSKIDDDDCHNPDQSVTGCNDEQFAELLKARQAWFDDEWCYCGIVVSVSKNGFVLDDHAASLWGIELNYPGSDNSYLTEVANDLADGALDVGRDILNNLCGKGGAQ